MKFNKLITKGLALGIILNSTSMLSYANTEIPNRYQTLEGEYITIDDSIEGNLEEIEIFGNTIQDLNNLEDIQSVGDLYVDEDGNPILDKQGREQYKIDIVSGNKNLDTAFLNKNNPDKGWINSGNGTNPLKYSDSNSAYYTETHRGFIYNNLKPNTKYTFSADLKETGKIFNGHRYGVVFQNPIYGMMDIEFSSEWQRCSITVTSNSNGSLYFIFYNSYYIKNVQLEEGLKNTDFYNRQQNKTSIILPCKLQKVGDVSDRLYWDSNKNRYVVDKYIKEWIIDFRRKSVDPYYGKEINFHRLNVLNYYEGDDIANLRDDKWKVSNYIPISDKMVLDDNSYLHGNLYGKDFAIGMTWDGYLRLDISKEYKPTVKDANDFISNLGVIKFLIIKRKIEPIETNITSKLKIPTYNEKTHIYIDSENDINPTLKVTIDRLPQIAKEAVAQAENDNSNHNIALARRYINMLPESSYKDQLQEQLSNIFSSDMALDMKTATSNLDLYIKCENILQMSLDTNQISFDDFSGIENVVKENAVSITINSSLPYQLNAYLPSEIQNSDKTKTLDKNILNIKESSESDYQTFTNTTDKIVLKDNCSSGNYLIHGVDLKLAGGIAHEKDVYKAIIKLEAEQK